MSRAEILLEKYLDGEETAEEAEELARLLRDDPAWEGALVDALMLEADLYDSYAGISQIRSAPRSRRRWSGPQLLVACTVAVFLLLGLVVVLLAGRSPAAPQPAPIPPVAPRPEPRRVLEKEHEEHESEEDEYRKGLREVERKRQEGKIKEAEKKLREIEWEREKHRRERRSEDR